MYGPCSTRVESYTAQGLRTSILSTIILLELYNIQKVKVKVQVYSLISSLKTYHPTLHLTPWSLDLFIRELFQLHGEHTVLQPFRRIELIDTLPSLSYQVLIFT